MKNGKVLNNKIDLQFFDPLGSNAVQQKEILWNQVTKFINANLKHIDLKDKTLQLYVFLKENQNGIQLKIDGIDQLIKYSDIIRAEANVNYTLFYTTLKKQPILTSKTLKFYTSNLLKNSFIKPHRSHIVNLLFIKKFNLKENEIELTIGNKIKVARRRRKLLTSFY